MKHISYLTFLILFLTAGWDSASAQDFTVASFDIVPTDLTARTNSRIDANGRPCAVIKVYVKDAITATGGPVIGDIVDRGMEKWVYVSHDSKKIQLLFKEHMPLYITFNEFNYPTVTGQMTYVMKLTESGNALETAIVDIQNTNVTNNSEIAKTNLKNQDKYDSTPSDLFDRGLAAEKNSDYAEAVNWYRQAADQGHARAQNNLGYLYENGYGVLKDNSEAAKWYRKAAEQGYANAQTNLGNMYRNGFGVLKDESEALRWYRKAAEQGYARAQTNLGYMYENGYGVLKDNTEAAKWYRKAAEQGYANAQINLGYMYDNGYGVTQDYSEAVKWYWRAAEQGNAIAQYNLGQSYRLGRGVSKDLKEARRWYEKAAAQGDSDAAQRLKEL